MNTLKANPHDNNFDVLRLILACTVIVSHSYDLSGLGSNDWLHQHSHQQAIFSYLGVRGFFTLSGFLITESLFRSKSLIQYFRNRILRIFPALIVLVLLTAFVFAPLLSSKNYGEHFSQSSTWSYALNNIILRPIYKIDGVFESLPYPNVINGSLWTLPYEFSFYIGLALLFFLRRFPLYFGIVLSAIIAICLFGYYSQTKTIFGFNTIPVVSLSVYTSFELGIYFGIGGLLSVAQIRKWNNIWLASAAALGLLLSLLIAGAFEYTKFLFIPISVISIGLLRFPYIGGSSRWGDASYGIYIWSFPIQQILMYLFAPSFEIFLILSLLLSYLAGLASWHLIEKKALRWK